MLGKVKYSQLSLKPLRLQSPNTRIQNILELMVTESQVGIVSHQDPNHIIAIISHIDLVRYIIPKIQQRNVLLDSIESILTLQVDDESYLVWERNIQDEIFDSLVAFSKGLHHGLITDVNKNFLLVQSDICSFMLQVPDLGFHLSTPIIELFPEKTLNIYKELIQLNSQDTILQGYNLIIEKKIPAIPVVDENGEFLGALTTRMITSIDYKNPLLSEPLSSLFVNNDNASAVSTCSPNDRCYDIIDGMLKNKVSRSWCLVSNKLTGVISFSDIIGLAIKTN